MFIIAQLPLADFRPLVNGGKGRLSVPDWSSDDLGSGFVRGLGKYPREMVRSRPIRLGDRDFQDRLPNSSMFGKTHRVHHSLSPSIPVRREYCTAGAEAGHKIPSRLGDRFEIPSRSRGVEFADSPLEEAVTSELVSEMPISLVTGKNTGNSAPIPTRALINASQSKVLRPKFPGTETGKFSKAEQRIDLPHQSKLLRDQRKSSRLRKENVIRGPSASMQRRFRTCNRSRSYDLSARAAASTLEMRS